MKKRIRRLYNKLLTMLLTLLGFGSTFAFMACYGPPPQNVNYIDTPADIDSVVTDNVSQDSLALELE